MSNNGQPGPFQSDAFLRPESMVTPGALGAMTMLITNSLHSNFAFLDHKIMAIVLAFLFGAVAIINSNSLWLRLVFYIINSLIIFAVATGSNTIGVGVSGPGSPPGSGMLLRSAYAWSPVGIDQSVQTPFSRTQFFQPWFGPSQEKQQPQVATMRISVACPDSDCSQAPVPQDLIGIIGIQTGPINGGLASQTTFISPSHTDLGETSYVTIALQQTPSRVRITIPTADAPAPYRNELIAGDEKKPAPQIDLTLIAGGTGNVTVYVRPELWYYINGKHRFAIQKIEPTAGGAA